MRPDPLLLLGLALVAAAALYLTLGARGDWAFVLALRGEALLSLLVVGAAVSFATVMFQTVAGDRVLTPSVMGFDSLYLLVQTALVFGLGGLGYAMLPPLAKFSGETAVLAVAGLALFGALFRGRGRDILRLALVGIVLGVLFRSLASFLQRLIAPSEFSVLQGASFARFGRAEPELLWVAAALTVAAIGGSWAMRRRLDVMALGRDAAIGLGLDYRREARRVLALVATLVAVSTALVGPVAFLGLLVVSLARAALGDWRHARLLPGAALVASLTLVAGQTMFERLFGLASALSIVVEFCGGLVFLALVIRRRR